MTNPAIKWQEKNQGLFFLLKFTAGKLEIKSLEILQILQQFLLYEKAYLKKKNNPKKTPTTSVQEDTLTAQILSLIRSFS